MADRMVAEHVSTGRDRAGEAKAGRAGGGHARAEQGGPGQEGPGQEGTAQKASGGKASKRPGPGAVASRPERAGQKAEERESMEQVTERVPTVIVDDLHITYRVYGTSAGKGSAPSALKRMIRRRKSPALREVEAIRGVSFTAYEGESIGLIGRNGSGKSTLLRAIAGLLPPTKGKVYTIGQPSLLGVTAALMNQLSGERNVVLGCLAMGMKPAEVRERYDDIVEFSGLGDFIDLPMRTYSSGMSQRLRFAIAAAKSHDVLLIDEALATGDADFRRRSEERIRELRDEAGTVFLVSHSLDVVTSTCNRAIWLDNGQVKMDGDAESVVNAYTEAVSGSSGRAARAARRRARRAQARNGARRGQVKDSGGQEAATADAAPSGADDRPAAPADSGDDQAGAGQGAAPGSGDAGRAASDSGSGSGSGSGTESGGQAEREQPSPTQPSPSER